MHEETCLLEYEEPVPTGRNAFVEDSVDPGHLPLVGVIQSARFIVKEVVVVHAVLLGQALDSNQIFGVFIVAPVEQRMVSAVVNTCQEVLASTWGA